jgi:EAL domain-containing protein (putative c-di-GMP-specific phosphodiesterase class I)
VAAILALAEALGLSTIAEGVETAEQLAILQELGCGHAQGFLWSPAIPPGELFERFGGGTPRVVMSKASRLDRESSSTVSSSPSPL